MDIVEGELVPALNEVGEGFEKKTVFLPQLLMSAEAAGAAFEAVRGRIAATGGQAGKGTVVVATVQGDIHDIGKNIARALLENYGYTVVDLGKDVPPEAVVEAARKSGAPLVGLSALMTTTVESMEKTIRLLREKRRREDRRRRRGAHRGLRHAHRRGLLCPRCHGHRAGGGERVRRGLNLLPRARV